MLLRHYEHTVVLNAVSFRSTNIVHSVPASAQTTIFVVCKNVLKFQSAEILTCVMPNVFPEKRKDAGFSLSRSPRRWYPVRLDWPAGGVGVSFDENSTLSAGGSLALQM